METFTDEIFVREMSMKYWVEESLSNRKIVVTADSSLLRNEQHFTVNSNCTSSIMRLAIERSANKIDQLHIHRP
ncbi:hypothetical protein PTKIN_Ptkin05aG0130400 [Pterospermum kingtungense]